jgi:hypothetical protein
MVFAALVVPIGLVPKERLGGERLTAGVMPVPVRYTDWAPPGPLSEMTKVALRVPVADGVMVTVSVQAVPTATELPQLLL